MHECKMTTVVRSAKEVPGAQTTGTGELSLIWGFRGGFLEVTFDLRAAGSRGVN